MQPAARWLTARRCHCGPRSLLFLRSRRWSCRTLVKPRILDHEDALEQLHKHEKADAQRAQENDGHKHRRGVEGGLHLDHEIAEAPARSDKLTDDGTGDRQDRPYLHGREEIGERARELNLSEDLPPRALQCSHEVEKIGLHFAQAAGRRDQDGEEGEEKGEEDVGADAITEPDDQQRAERHFGDHADCHEKGEEHVVEQPEPGKKECQENRGNHRDAVADKDLGCRYQGVVEPSVTRLAERLEGGDGGGEDKRADHAAGSHGVPDEQDCQMHQNHHDVVRERLSQITEYSTVTTARIGTPAHHFRHLPNLLLYLLLLASLRSSSTQSSTLLSDITRDAFLAVNRRLAETATSYHCARFETFFPAEL